MVPDVRAVWRALPCRRPTCQARPGGWCRSASGNTTATHQERKNDAAALTPDQRAAAVEALRIRQAELHALVDRKLDPGQLADRARITAAWDRICQEAQ